MENLESYEVLQIRFQGLETHGILIWVMESGGN